jgi:hypothetical protein
MKLPACLLIPFMLLAIGCAVTSRPAPSELKPMLSVKRVTWGDMVSLIHEEIVITVDHKARLERGGHVTEKALTEAQFDSFVSIVTDPAFIAELSKAQNCRDCEYLRIVITNGGRRQDAVIPISSISDSMVPYIYRLNQLYTAIFAQNYRYLLGDSWK